MMVQAKRIYLLMIKVKKLIFFFASRYFLKEIEKCFYQVLETREFLGELKKAEKTLTCSSCSHSISHSPKLVSIT